MNAGAYNPLKRAPAR